jgi:hypothetical protein
MPSRLVIERHAARQIGEEKQAGKSQSKRVEARHSQGGSSCLKDWTKAPARGDGRLSTKVPMAVRADKRQRGLALHSPRAADIETLTRSARGSAPCRRRLARRSSRRGLQVRRQLPAQRRRSCNGSKRLRDLLVAEIVRFSGFGRPEPKRSRDPLRAQPRAGGDLPADPLVAEVVRLSGFGPAGSNRLRGPLRAENPRSLSAPSPSTRSHRFR